MQVFFKMIIDDGEKYYAGEDPGIAIAIMSICED